MAKGKRVSNRSGGDQGARSHKGRWRELYNKRRRRSSASAGRNRLVVAGQNAVGGPARIPGPPRSSVLGRITAPIKRFFRSR